MDTLPTWAAVSFSMGLTSDAYPFPTPSAPLATNHSLSLYNGIYYGIDSADWTERDTS